jgi:hypothetical protein
MIFLTRKPIIIINSGIEFIEIIKIIKTRIKKMEKKFKIKYISKQNYKIKIT